MRKALILLMLCAGCREQGAERDQAGKGGDGIPSATRQESAASTIAALPGLYEGGGEPKDQLCIREEKGKARFGIVAHGGSVASCSGTGSATRSGVAVTLSFGGDVGCRVSARIKGDSLIFPPSVPSSCSYYCGVGTSLGGRRFQLRAAGNAAATKARDLVGDPLCEPRAD